jgi:hypothetical protein
LEFSWYGNVTAEYEVPVEVLDDVDVVVELEVVVTVEDSEEVEEEVDVTEGETDEMEEVDPFGVSQRKQLLDLGSMLFAPQAEQSQAFGLFLTCDDAKTNKKKRSIPNQRRKTSQARLVFLEVGSGD